jgi:hypothetical protein
MWCVWFCFNLTALYRHVRGPALSCTSCIYVVCVCVCACARVVPLKGDHPVYRWCVWFHFKLNTLYICNVMCVCVCLHNGIWGYIEWIWKIRHRFSQILSSVEAHRVRITYHFPAPCVPHIPLHTLWSENSNNTWWITGTNRLLLTDTQFSAPSLLCISLSYVQIIPYTRKPYTTQKLSRQCMQSALLLPCERQSTKLI